MATKIKLMRLGKMREPHYRIVVADARTKRDGRAIETIGKYHPKEDPSFIEVDCDRAAYWLGVGAQPTEAVAAIFKVTGDWQKFKGLPAPPPMQVAAPKADKARDVRRRCPRVGRITDVTAPLTAKQAKKATPKAAAEAPAAEAPAAEAAPRRLLPKPRPRRPPSRLQRLRPRLRPPPTAHRRSRRARGGPRAPGQGASSSTPTT